MMPKTAVTAPAEITEEQRGWERCSQCSNPMSLRSIFPAFGTLYMHLKCLWCGCQAIISVDENGEPLRLRTPHLNDEDSGLYFRVSSVRRPVEEAVLRREMRAKRRIGKSALKVKC